MKQSFYYYLLRIVQGGLLSCRFDNREGTRTLSTTALILVFCSYISLRTIMSSLKRRVAPAFYRTSLQPAYSTPSPYHWRKVLLYVPLLAILGVLLNYHFGVDRYDTSYQGLLTIEVDPGAVATIGRPVQKNSKTTSAWCDRVQEARSRLSSNLQIQVPCETMKPAKSAIVCMLTDGVSEEKKTRVVFTATNYIHGAMALGASLQDRIDPEQTHMLLLLREGFVLDPNDLIRLQSVGWIIGTAPNFPLKQRYLPRFPRYKTTYTKISAIGLEEYECAMLMDADTLAVGDLRDILTCQIFTEPQHRVATGLDLYHGYWHYFNTGSVLWKTSSKEMDRVFALSQNSSWMKAFSSDQDFLNNVYPERLNNTFNREVIAGKFKYMPGGQVVDMGWEYNAQTHVEVMDSEFWLSKRPNVKILHYTEKKGWQCEKRQGPPPPLSETPPQTCRKKEGRNIPICYCREAQYYWAALNTAMSVADRAIAAAANGGGKAL